MPNECLTWHQAKPPSGVMTGWGLCIRRNDGDERRDKSLPRAAVEEVLGLTCTPYFPHVPSPLEKVPSLRGG